MSGTRYQVKLSFAYGHGIFQHRVKKVYQAMYINHAKARDLASAIWVLHTTPVKELDSVAFKRVVWRRSN
jgi:hypothetical protein